MDTMMHIEDIAERIGIPVATVRSYAERYALYLPVARTGAEVSYPPDSVTLLEEIDQAVAAGATFDEIEGALQAYIPSMRLVQEEEPTRDGDPLYPTLHDIKQVLNEQQELIAHLRHAVREATDRAATAEQFHGLRAETASLAAALAMRDAQLDHANALIISELREAVKALQGEIGLLRSEVQRARSGSATPPAPPAPAKSGDSASGQKPPHDHETDAHAEKDHGRRTPRRMGQPLRVNGINGFTKN